jgi:hypothetical protein
MLASTMPKHIRNEEINCGNHMEALSAFVSIAVFLAASRPADQLIMSAWL